MAAVSQAPTFAFVYIPADPAQPIEERTLPLPVEVNDQVSCITTMAKAHFTVGCVPSDPF
jgi:hypothetical protein